MWSQALVQRLSEHARRVLQRARAADPDDGEFEEYRAAGPGPARGGGGPRAAAFQALAGSGNRWLTAKLLGPDGQPAGAALPVVAMSYGRAGLHRQIDLASCNPVLDAGDLIWIAPLSLTVDGTTFAWGCVAPTFRAIGCAGA